MARSATEAWVANLVSQVPSLARLLDQHVAQNDELLPHVFLGEVTRIVEGAMASGPSRVRDVTRILSVMEQGLGSGDPTVVELISVSFLENLDQQASSYQPLRSMMGPLVRNELKRYERR